MEENLQNELEQLRKENEQLRNKVDKTAQKAQRKQENRKKALSWTWRLFTGESLHKNFNRWFTEFHSDKNVSADASASLLTSIVQRFVRVRMLSVLLLMFSVIPSLVSIYILYKQNQLIKTQNLLVEGSRRSSYSFQLASLFDAIDRNGYSQSKHSARIIGLSNILKPYNYLDTNAEGEKTVYYSPERAQLLLFLLNSNISKEKLSYLFDNTDFSYCDLRNTNLSRKHMAGINLENSNLKGCELNGANLNNASLKGAILNEIQFSNGFANNTNFSYAKLKNAKITRTELKNAVFNEVDKEDAVIQPKE